MIMITIEHLLFNLSIFEAQMSFLCHSHLTRKRKSFIVNYLQTITFFLKFNTSRIYALSTTNDFYDIKCDSCVDLEMRRILRHIFLSLDSVNNK